MKKRIITLALALVMVLSIVPMSGAASFKFTDVPEYHKDRLAIEYCVNNEFITGYTATKFEPDSPLTREQFAVIWGRTYHLRRHTFNDVTKVPDEFENAILIMQALGHVNGVSSTEFGRTLNISREQAIAIAHRAYLPGVDGDDAYKDFADNALISDWARDSVSACKDEGLLDGVFTGNELKPTHNITRGEICHLIFNIMKKQYEITVDPDIVNGSVTVDKTPDADSRYWAYPGETVNLIVTATPNYILVPGSLKFNGTPITSGTSFVMPFGDVTITAEFAPELDNITLDATGMKTTYNVGEKLDLTGLVVTANYAGATGSKVVTGFTSSPAHNETLTFGGEIDMKVSYTENGVTKTATQKITITAP